MTVFKLGKGLYILQSKPHANWSYR